MRHRFYAAMLLKVVLICLVAGPVASGANEEFRVTELFLKADDGRPWSVSFASSFQGLHHRQWPRPNQIHIYTQRWSNWCCSHHGVQASRYPGRDDSLDSR
jgi:hypothetical protein